MSSSFPATSGPRPAGVAPERCGGRESEALAREAITLLESTDELNEQANAQLALAHVLQTADRQDEAAEATESAVRLLREKSNETLLARISI